MSLQGKTFFLKGSRSKGFGPTFENRSALEQAIVAAEGKVVQVGTGDSWNKAR